MHSYITYYYYSVRLQSEENVTRMCSQSAIWYCQIRTDLDTARAVSEVVDIRDRDVVERIRTYS